MKIENFLVKLNSCKKSLTFIDFSKNVIIIYSRKNIESKNNNFKILIIHFNNLQQPLTIFEAGLLWGIYVENKKYYDYADYHKCFSGKKFIENIKSVEVV